MAAYGQIEMFAPRRLRDLAAAAERAMALLGWSGYSTCAVFRGQHIVSRIEPGLDCTQIIRQLGWTRCALLRSDQPGPLEQRVSAAVQEIPPAIRDRFGALSGSLCIGPQSIYQSDDEVILLGRTRLSIGFSGYGAPLNWAECRRRILEHPEILAVKALFEEQVGPLQLAATWT